MNALPGSPRLAPATRSAPRERRPSTKASWRTCTNPNGLEKIHRQDVNLVTWRRTLPPGLDAPFAAWAKAFPAAFDQIVSTNAYDLGAATAGLDEAILPWVTQDVALLLARFAHLVGASRLRVSFRAVRTDACRKFHMDYVRYRLVTTYTGPGTEWVPDDAVRREALEHPADCPCDANKDIVRDTTAIRHARAGDVIVMKGARHAHGRGAVHRSPPVEDTGRVRLVLIANTVERS